MDKARAHQWFSELLGTEVAHWRPVELLGAGKSAIVVKADRGGASAALKIFEPEIVERFGLPAQLERIKRECLLIGRDIPHLVKILEGGQDSATGYLYVVMELLAPPWKSLDEQIGSVPRDKIWSLISAVASAASGLETLGLVHRDIKPSNIMVSPDFEQCRVLDLGVMRPIGATSITDEISRPFIGTLRYSSPEFLLREEKDTIEGWRAITFYQLGGVLHDLIMRRPLFVEFSEPYARLVKAVQEHIPTVDAPDVHTDLLLLCKNCLLKEPDLRFRCVTWEHFNPPAITAESAAEAARERVKNRHTINSMQRLTVPHPDHVRRQMQIARETVTDSLKSAVREIVSTDEFPLSAIVDIPVNDPAASLFDVQFEQSEEHEVDAPFAVRFEICVLDANERVSRITCRGPSRGVVTGPASAETLFVGVFEHEAVRPSIRDHLYVLLDRIQGSKP
jgi:eukaryotic-like serine/threonine-protein kinase